MPQLTTNKPECLVTHSVTITEDFIVYDPFTYSLIVETNDFSNVGSYTFSLDGEVEGVLKC